MELVILDCSIAKNQMYLLLDTLMLTELVMLMIEKAPLMVAFMLELIWLLG